MTSLWHRCLNALQGDANTRALHHRIAELTDQRDLARRWAVALENENARLTELEAAAIALVAKHDRLTGLVPTSELIDALGVNIDEVA